MQAPPCEICGSSAVRTVFYKNEYPYQKCPVCGLYRIYPQLSDAELNTIYATGYFKRWGEESKTFITIKQKNFSRIFAMLNDTYPQGKRLLDIGAATGILMEEGRRRGYEVYGIEASSDGSAAIAEKFGDDRIYKGYYDENCSHWENGGFDLIFMVDVLEHLRNPRKAVEKAKNLLKENGRLLICCPDTGSASRFLLEKSWPHFNEQHLFSFSKKNIIRLLKESELKIMKKGPMLKNLSIAYMLPMLKMQNNIFCKLMSSAFSLMPKRLKYIGIPFYSGSFIVIAKK